MVHLLGAQVVGHGSDLKAAGKRQTVGTVGRNGVGVWRIAEQRLGVGWDVVLNARVGRDGRAVVEVRRHRVVRTIRLVGRNRNFFLIEVQPVAATNDYPLIEQVGVVGEAELRAEVARIRCPGLATANELNAGIEATCICTKDRMRQVVLLTVQSVEIVVTNTGIDGQVRRCLPIILDKATIDPFTLVKAV